MEKIFIASDHAAFDEKEELITFLKNRFEILDLGPTSSDRVDYPDFGKKIAKSVIE
jgi:ribose 5-phosphate isomerase B